MEIIPVEAGPVATIGYLVNDEINKKAVVIDVPIESAAAFDKLIKEKDTKLEAILLTHTHWDHSAEAPALHRSSGAPVYVNQADEYRLTDPMKHSILQLGFDLEDYHDAKFLGHGDTFKFGDIVLEVIHTPGHTEGGLCFACHKSRIIFTGDTLFHGSVGRVDLPGGSGKTLINSITNRLMSLDDNYMVYPGHGPETSIGFERNRNPFINGIYSI